MKLNNSLKDIPYQNLQKENLQSEKPYRYLKIESIINILAQKIINILAQNIQMVSLLNSTKQMGAGRIIKSLKSLPENRSKGNIS